MAAERTYTGIVVGPEGQHITYSCPTFERADEIYKREFIAFAPASFSGLWEHAENGETRCIRIYHAMEPPP